MSRWYRRYTGTVSDPKIAEAALIAGCSRSVAIATWDMILESAAESNSNGAFKATSRNVAATLHEKLETIDAVFKSLAELNMIADSVVVAWSKRQFQSDSSNERVKKYRERRKAAGLPQQQWFSASIKSQVMAKNDGCCVYCGTKEKMTIDHSVPLNRGGSDDVSNLQPACRSCNADKRDMTHDEYMAWPGRKSGDVTLQQRPHSTETDNTDTEKNNPLTPLAGGMAEFTFDGKRIVVPDACRSFWLQQFDEKGFELALIECAGTLQPNSRSHSVHAQVERKLAVIARDKRDRDRRYAEAVAKSKPKTAPVIARNGCTPHAYVKPEWAV